MMVEHVMYVYLLAIRLIDIDVVLKILRYLLPVIRSVGPINGAGQIPYGPWEI